MFSIRKVKVSHNSAQDQHLYESYFLFLKNPALTEVQRYVFDSLLKHQLTIDNSFAFIRSCGNEVYKVEKSIIFFSSSKIRLLAFLFDFGTVCPL